MAHLYQELNPQSSESRFFTRSVRIEVSPRPVLYVDKKSGFTPEKWAEVPATM